MIVSDQLNHASIIDGARLSRAEIKVFPHKDVDAADALLAETARPGRHQLLITDGVFSMDGDIAPLPGARRGGREARRDHDDRRRARLRRARRRAARAPSTTSASHGRVDIQVGTLSKAIGVLGGFIAGPPHLIEWLREPRAGRSCSPRRAPPAGRRGLHRGARRHRATSPSASSGCGRTPRSSRRGCTRSASTPGTRETPITPVITGEEEKAQDARRGCCSKKGVFMPGDRVPDRRPRAGARAHDRDGRSHRGGPARGAGRVRSGRPRAGAHLTWWARHR